MFSSGCRGTVRGDFRRELSGDREGPPARPPPAPGGPCLPQPGSPQCAHFGDAGLERNAAGSPLQGEGAHEALSARMNRAAPPQEMREALRL